MQGIPGIPGPMGDTGQRGEIGEMGPEGQQGSQGEVGPAGGKFLREGVDSKIRRPRFWSYASCADVIEFSSGHHWTKRRHR